MTERSRLAPEGRLFVLAGSLVAAGLLVRAVLGRAGPLAWILAGAAAALAGFMAFFFRDPARSGPRDPALVVAPADGRLLGSVEVEETEYLRGPALRVSIFMSLLDVHVNRFPVSGRVEWRARHSGGFAPAWRDSAASGNERLSLGIRREDGRRVLVRQVTGLVARRIVNRAEEGDRVRQGERMGLIRFGSRVDVFLPRDAELIARGGDRALGGVTVLARLGPRPEGTGDDSDRSAAVDAREGA